jgi:hypothetical protein
MTAMFIHTRACSHTHAGFQFHRITLHESKHSLVESFFFIRLINMCSFFKSSFLYMLNNLYYLYIIAIHSVFSKKTMFFLEILSESLLRTIQIV